METWNKRATCITLCYISEPFLRNQQITLGGATFLSHPVDIWPLANNYDNFAYCHCSYITASTFILIPCSSTKVRLTEPWHCMEYPSDVDAGNTSTWQGWWRLQPLRGWSHPGMMPRRRLLLMRQEWLSLATASSSH